METSNKFQGVAKTRDEESGDRKPGIRALRVQSLHYLNVDTKVENVYLVKYIMCFGKHLK
jgi:hypothetical protein